MRVLALFSVCAFLAAAVACSSSSDEGGGTGEIRTQEDVQRLFETIMPELVAAFAELANSQSAAASDVPASKQNGTSSIACPQGGSLDVNTNTGEATLAACGVSGVTISGTLLLLIQSLGGTNQATFSGPLTVSGTFNGMVEVLDSLVEWADPPTTENTFWSVTVYVSALNQSFTVTSGSMSGSNERCVEACNAIEAACASTGDDCLSDCSSDFAGCPNEMGAVLDCVLANRNQLLCDPDQDQGLAEAPCEAQHAAVQADPCGKDPF